jgi:diguanylate cyclase (GGDEF)-like protein
MRTKRDLSPDLQADLQAEQFRILRTQIPILYAVLSIDIGLLCLSVFGSVSTILSIIVPGVFALLIVGRAGVWIMRRGTRPRGDQVARILTTTTMVSGSVSLGLGLWGVALLNSGMAEEPFVPIFVAFGAIACAYSLASLPLAAFATIFLATAPVILALFMSGVRVQQTTALNLLLIFVLILRLIMHQYEYLIGRIVSHAEVKTLAFADPLTGLPNRRAFIECLEWLAGETCADRTGVAVAMIDLDGFKAINDTYGHAAGDGVLIQAAERLRAVCEGHHMVARLGGDEFAALIVGADDDDQVGDVGRTIVAEMSRPFLVGGSQIRLAASVGLAMRIEDGAAPISLISQADVALYEVKHSAGNGALLFAPDMAKRLHRRMAIEQALRATDPPPRIAVVYQPIFDARTLQITTYEALARWDHPELGHIDPLEFIAVAEKTGTITALSRQIFASAIQEASHWPSSIGLSLNLSAVELTHPGTPLSIMSLCHRYHFDPRRLEIEVTETTVLADFDVARQQLELLRDTGIRIVLDDFGAGYASIAYLKEITFDRVKIDGELIADIICSDRARRLLEGILQLCSAVGLPATAEKVEHEKQRTLLTSLGCDRLQGYLLGRPISADTVKELTALERCSC